MQISRHWRLNAQRYRLEGTRQENGALNLQERHTLPALNDARSNDETRETEVVTAEKTQTKTVVAA